MPPFVVIRERNDMPLLRETLSMVARQSTSHHLLVFDNASRDGSRQEAERYADRVIGIPEGEYVPGRVLNRAMRNSNGEFVVFLNSDCTPLDEFWLEELLNGFENENVAAVFGRQMPRPGCDPLMARDTEATFGDGSRQRYWRHCFSMASSAIRRCVWEEMPFREDIQYSEDIDWTWRARQAGWQIRYTPNSRVYHSHNYSPRQFFRRHYGEGRAEAVIFEWSPLQRSFLRYSIAPYVRQVIDDQRHSLKSGSLRSMLRSPILRAAQMLGRRSGFRDGNAQRKEQA